MRGRLRWRILATTTLPLIVLVVTALWLVQRTVSAHVHDNIEQDLLRASAVFEDMLAARLRVAKVIPYQGSRTPFISNLSLAVCSGLLLIFAFPDWNLWSLGWVGAAPLIMAVVREQRFWRSLVLGWVTGTIFYAGSSYWVTHSMHNYGEIPLALAYVLLTILASILGFFTGIFAGATAIGVKRFGGWAMLAAPFIWAASEWARQQVTQ